MYLTTLGQRAVIKYVFDFQDFAVAVFAIEHLYMFYPQQLHYTIHTVTIHTLVV